MKISKSNFSLIALMFFSILTYSSSVKAVINIEVILQRTAESDGSDPSTIDPVLFKKQILAANKAYYFSGIHFVFDEVKNFPPIVNNSYLHRDFELAKNETLNHPKNVTPKVTDRIYHEQKELFAFKNFPGKLVVFSGAGNTLKWNKKDSKWEIIRLEGAYSSPVLNYIRWHWFNDKRDYLFAHEVGHYLHLGHTFGWQPETIQEAIDQVIAWRSKGYNQNQILDFFNGDRDSINDTPSDPGIDLFKLLTNQNPSDCQYTEFALEYNFNNRKEMLIFKPKQSNIMSYFFCDKLDMYLTAGQEKRVLNALEFGNRFPVYISNPGISLPLYSPTISGVTHSGNSLMLTTTSVDNKVLVKAFDPNNGWLPSLTGPWNQLYGSSVGTPAITSWGPKRIDIFARGTDLKIRHKAFDQKFWYPMGDVWEELGGNIAGDVTASTWGSDSIYLFARGYDNALYGKFWSENGGWYPTNQDWKNLGKDIGGDPVAVSWGKGRYDIFVRGKTGELLHKAFTGGKWYPSETEFENLGGKFPLGAKPAVTAWGNNRLDIVMKGMDSSVYHLAWTGNSWTNWFSIGGQIEGNPSMTSWSENRLDIVVIGKDLALYHKAWNGQTWYPNTTGWEYLGGKLYPNQDPKIMSYAPGRLDIFVRSFGKNVLHKAWNDSTGWVPAGLEFEDQDRNIDP